MEETFTPAMSQIFLDFEKLENGENDGGLVEDWMLEENGWEEISMDVGLELKNWIENEQVREELRPVTQLYPWQREVLEKISDGRNLVLRAPTSSGKTLISDIQIIRTLTRGSGTIGMYVVPFTAMVEELEDHYSTLLQPLGIEVNRGFGKKNDSGSGLSVMTIERANSELNRLLKKAPKRLEQLGIIVVDEIHMLGSRERGCRLELFLTKIQYFNQKISNQKTGTQIIAMSATLPDDTTLPDWLNAEYYSTKHRKIPIQHYVFLSRRELGVGHLISAGENQNLRRYNLTKKLPYYELIEEVIQLEKGNSSATSGSVLIFCQSRAKTEKLMNSFLQILKGKKVNPIHKDIQISGIGKELSSTGFSTSKILMDGLAYGCSYFHSGLSRVERKILQQALLSKIIKVVFSTTGLSTGVNMPVQRVIFDSVTGFSSKSMDPFTFCQASGRAGRTNLTTSGDAIVYAANDATKSIANKLQMMSIPKIHSCLAEDIDGLDLLVIESKSLSMMKNTEEILQHSFYFHQLKNTPLEATISQQLQRTIQKLTKSNFLRPDLSPSKLNQASFELSYNSRETQILLNRIQQIRICGLVLVRKRQLLFLCIRPPFRSRWKQDVLTSLLGNSITRLEKKNPGIADTILNSCVGGRELLSHPNLKYEQCLLLADFLEASMLDELVFEEKSLEEISNLFQMAPGDIQQSLTNAYKMCSRIQRFCKALSFNILAAAFEDLEDHLEFICNESLLELVSDLSITSETARVLYNAKLRSVKKVASISYENLLEILQSKGEFVNETTSYTELADRIRRKAIDRVKELDVNFLTPKSNSKNTIDISPEKCSFSPNRRRAEILPQREIMYSDSSPHQTTDLNKYISPEKCTSPSLKQDKFSDSNHNYHEGSESPIFDRKDKSKDATIQESENFETSHPQVSLQEHLNVSNHLISKKSHSNRLVQNQFLRNLSNSGTLTKRSGNVYDFPRKRRKTGVAQVSAASSSHSNNSFSESEAAEYIQINKISKMDPPIPKRNIKKDCTVKKRRKKMIRKIKGKENPHTESNETKDRPGRKYDILDGRRTKIISEGNLRKSGNHYDILLIDSSTDEFLALFKNFHLLSLTVEHDNMEIKAIYICRNSNKMIYCLKIVGDKDRMMLDGIIKHLERKDSSGKHEVSVIISNSKDQLQPLIKYLNRSPDFKLRDMFIAYHLLHPENSDSEKSTQAVLDSVKFKREKIGFTSPNSDQINRSLATDAVISYVCHEKLRDELIDQKLWKAYAYETRIPIVLAHMELNGMNFDTSIFEDMHSLEAEKENLINSLCEKVKVYRSSKVDSQKIIKEIKKSLTPTLIRIVIFDLLNISNNDTSTRKENLQELYQKVSGEKKEIIGIIVRIRKVNSLMDKFFRPLRHDVREVNGSTRLFPSWSQISTISGRFASTNPNVQTIQKILTLKDGFIIRPRKCFIPSTGLIFIGADYKHFELRIQAHIIQDPNMIESCKTNDPIRYLAGKMMNTSPENVSDEKRNDMKSLIYGALYGRGAKGMAVQLNIHKDEAQKMQKEFKAFFSSTENFKWNMVKNWGNLPIQTAFFQRKFQKPLPAHGNERAKRVREAFNFIIQGSAADILKYALIHIHQNLETLNKEIPHTKARIYHTIHDEVIVECSPLCEEKVQQILQHCMVELPNEKFNLNPGMCIVIKTANNWASLNGKS